MLQQKYEASCPLFSPVFIPKYFKSDLKHCSLKAFMDIFGKGELLNSLRQSELKGKVRTGMGHLFLYSTFRENLEAGRDGQNHHMLMILKSKSNHLNKGDLKSK